MSLPTLEVPNYETIIPSSKKKVKFRPFLVKEYKVLLTASESSTDELARIITELVDVCTFNKLSIDKLPHFDLEYLFLQIRSKSIGEVVKLTKQCDKCENKIDFNFDINYIKLDKDVKDTKIFLTDNLGIIMRYPKFDEILDIASDMNINKMFDLIVKCVDTVFTKDDFYGPDSFTSEEIQTFIMNLTKDQFDKLENFLTSMPKIVFHTDVQCSNCGHNNDVKLEGLQNFFV